MIGNMVTVQGTSGNSMSGTCTKVDFLGNPIEVNCGGVTYTKCGGCFAAL